MIDLSVAIVAYNNYTDIALAVESLERFTSKGISKKVYIVDNSSNNKASGIDRESLKLKIVSYGDVEYLDTGENLGFGKGNNFVLPMIESKYHAIVNPDIVFVEDTFKEIIEFMQDPSIGMCIPKIVDENGDMQLAYRRDPTVCDMFIRFL